MNEQNIEEFVDRIDGAYPAAKLFVKNIYKTFKREQFLQQMTPDEGRRLFDLIIKMCDNVPSLGEVKMIYLTKIYQEQTKPVCLLCDNNLWVYPVDEHGMRRTRTNGLHDKQGNLLEYEYVIRCECYNS